MDVSFRMKVMYNVKHRYAIRLKFGGKVLTAITKIMLRAKASIYIIYFQYLLYLS